MRKVAKDIATGLFERLRAGEIDRIGIDEIRTAISDDMRSGDYHPDILEYAVTRAVVEMAL